MVTCALGFNTTVAPIVQLGLTPVFCDTAPGGAYVPSVADVAGAVTPRTKVIMVANLIGNVPDWAAIRARFPDVVLIEDSADTIGNAALDSDITTTSFYASHVITAARAYGGRP